MPVPGQILGGKYRLERLVGSGGFASVWAARNVMLDRQVALKILSENYARMPGFLPRFLREAKLASRAIHKNIVAVEDIDQTPDGLVFLVMELLEGHTLADELKGGKSLPLERSVEIIAATLEGLSAAHDRNIIHRDIKPANIFLTKEGAAGPRVRILDLGLAKDLVSDDELTTTDQMVGTPSYLAPEMFLGQQVRNWAPTADVFACGMLLFRMLAGGLPFDRSVANLPPIEQFLARAEFYQSVGEMPGPAQYVPGIPADVDSVVRKAISLQLSNRYGNAGEMLAALLQTSAAPGRSSSESRPSGRVSYRDLEDLNDLGDADEERSGEGDFDDSKTRVDANPWGLEGADGVRERAFDAPQRGAAPGGQGQAPRRPPAPPPLGLSGQDFSTRPSTEPTVQGQGAGLGAPGRPFAPVGAAGGVASAPAGDQRSSSPSVPILSPSYIGAVAESSQAPSASSRLSPVTLLGPGGAPFTPPEGGSSRGAVVPTTFPVSQAAPTPADPRGARPGRSKVVLVIGALLVLLFLLFVAVAALGAAWQMGLLGRGAGNQSGAAPAPVTAPVPPPALTPTAPNSAAARPSNPGVGDVTSLEVSSEPPGAAVLLDGLVVGTTPFQLSLPRSGQTKQLSVRAPGYRSVEQTIVLDQSHRLEFSLEPLAR